MHQKKVFVGMGVVLVLVCALLSFYGASLVAPPRDTVTGVKQTASAVPFTTLVQSTQSEILTRSNYLITSNDELNQLWKTVGAKGMPPAIDFSTQQILAVFAGSTTTSAIQVSKIEDNSSREVLVTIVEPEGACEQTDVSGIPYELVVVATTSLPLTHEDATITAPCSN